jgi:hypothetical protein
MRKRAPRMRKLTTILLWWSTRAIEDINRLTVTDSGDVLRRGTSRFAQMEAPPLDYFGVDNHRDTAELCSHSMVQGVASNDDAMTNSGETTRSDM